jgi:hypothetical protein
LNDFKFLPFAKGVVVGLLKPEIRECILKFLLKEVELNAAEIELCSALYSFPR